MKKIKLTISTFLLVILFAGCQKSQTSNIVPQANAGNSQVVTLPVSSLTLSGSGTDADGSIVAYLWSQVNGPEQANITNPGSATTSVSGFVPGTYIFQLMVTDDGGLTGVDTVSVLVNQSLAQTLTLQPSNNPDERMIAVVGSSDYSYTGGNEWVVDAWTVAGQPYIGRKAFKFDLSSIPSSATILSANLFLYSNNPPENGNMVDANFGTDNSLFLQQIISPWSPSTANWFNQPATTLNNQVSIPHTNQSSLDINVDVKTMVSSMVNNNANYGFLLRLQNEVAYTSRAFVSSYHASKPTMHPKLVVVYRP